MRDKKNKSVYQQIFGNYAGEIESRLIKKSMSWEKMVLPHENIIPVLQPNLGF